jgi:excisionase family DNA binding protein
MRLLQNEGVSSAIVLNEISAEGRESGRICKDSLSRFDQAHDARVAAVEISGLAYRPPPRREPAAKVVMKKRTDTAPESMQPRVLTVPEVCEYLRISRQTVYRMLRRKDIPGFRIAGDWRFNMEDLKRWTEKESQADEPKVQRDS